MDSQSKWPLVQLCYAGICAVIGGALIGIGVASDADPLKPIGGFILVIAAAYLVFGLWSLASTLRGD